MDSCLAQATDSLLIEVVIVDDGSTDDGVDVVKEKYGRLSNVRVITQPNAGVSAARNHGIAEATGEYIMFVDADDYLSQKALEPLIKHMTDADIEVLAHGAIVEPSTTPKSNASVNDCVLGNCMGGGIISQAEPRSILQRQRKRRMGIYNKA